MAETLLSVAQSFKSIQGEGPTMGKLSYFLQLSGCNLVCGGKGSEKDNLLHNDAEWRCDAIDMWIKGTQCKIPDVIKQLGGKKFIADLQNGCGLVISGGEPLLQQRSLKTFFKKLRVETEFIPHIEIETNGTIIPDPEIFEFVAQWNISPKLRNSGVELKERFNIDVISTLIYEMYDSYFKFVVCDYSDWMEVLKEWIIPFEISKNKVWLIPVAENKNQLIENSKEIIDICCQNNVNFSSRLQLFK